MIKPEPPSFTYPLTPEHAQSIARFVLHSFERATLHPRLVSIFTDGLVGAGDLAEIRERLLELMVDNIDLIVTANGATLSPGSLVNIKKHLRKVLRARASKIDEGFVHDLRVLH